MQTHTCMANGYIEGIASDSGSGLLNMVLKQLDGLWGKDLYNLTEAKISSRLSKNLLGENIHTKIMKENRVL